MSSRAAAALAALSAAALALAWFWSSRAPCGGWVNEVFGAVLWNQSDPGGYYLVNAHELGGFRGPMLYPGHPGLTLQIALRAIQAAFYALAAAPGEGFSAFVARRLIAVFLLSKLAVAAAHAASFWLAFAFARGLLARERAALFAAFGYATSLPVVYFLTRISGEPFMMACFFGCFAAAWECGAALERGRRGRALAFAAAAGAASSAALVTKFHFFWPLPLLGAAALACGDAAPFSRRAPRLAGARRAALAAYLAAASATLAGASALIDWRGFFAYWGASGMDGGTLAQARGLGLLQFAVLAAAARGAARVPLAAWLPGPTRSGLSFLCEAGFVLAAAAGAVLEWRRRGAPRARWLWPGLAGLYSLAIWAYRGLAVARDFHGFHYLFVFLGLAAVPFGRASDEGLERLRLKTPAARAAAAAAWLALIHQPVLWAAASALAFDAASYARVRAIGDALAAAGPGGRAAVISAEPIDPIKLLGLAVIGPTPPTRSRLIEAVAERFVVLRGPELPRAAGAPIDAVVAIVSRDGVERAEGPFTPEQWAARSAPSD
jgi:hypothetical protein